MTTHNDTGTTDATHKDCIADQQDSHGDGRHTPRPDRGVDLSKFQLNVLAVLAEGERYGLAIKEALEDYSGTNVNHGRLYPNLDTLIEQGYATKRQQDRRTNIYSITDRGRGVLLGHAAWILGNYVRGHDDVDGMGDLLGAIQHAAGSTAQAETRSVRATDGGQADG